MTLDRAAKDREQWAQRLAQRARGDAADVVFLYHMARRPAAFLSQRTRQALGFAADRSQHLEAAEFERLVHPADLAALRRYLAALERAPEGEILSRELRVKGADGRYRRLSVRGTVLACRDMEAVVKAVDAMTDMDTCRSADAKAAQSALPAQAAAAGNLTGNLGDILATLGDCFIALDRQYRIVDVNSKAEAWLRANRADLVGQSYPELIAPTAEHVQALREAIELGVSRSVDLRSVRRPGTWLNLQIHPTRDGASVFFRDITQRKRAERDAERSRRLLQSSLDALSSEIAILDESGAVLAVNKAWAAQTEPSVLSGARVGDDYLVHCERALAGEEGEALRRALRSVLAGERKAARLAYSVETGGERRWLQVSAARFEWDGGTHVIIANEDLTDVRQAREALAEMSGRMSSLREEERQRIAQELHDSTAQHLVAATLNLMTLKARAVAYPGVLKLLENVESSLEEATRELRVFTYLLHPLSLEKEGLERTLRGYLEGFARRTGLKSNMTVAGDVESLPFALQCSLLRIIQEALSNVHRHASATHVSVNLKVTPAALRLVVSDDGRGVQVAEGQGEPARKGVGIAGMRARLREFGGALEIHSEAHSGGRGTTLIATVPLPTERRQSHPPQRTPAVAFGGGSRRS